MADRRPAGIAGPLHRAVLSSGDAATLLGGQLRAEIPVAQVDALADGVGIADTARQLGIAQADFDRLASAACAVDPITELTAWFDTESRPRMRRALAAAVLAITEEKQ